jgi:hypothetical protein
LQPYSLKLSVMQVITIESEAYKSLIQKLDSIEKKTVTKPQSPENTWLDNQELCLLLKVTPRTLQNHRDNGILPYTQFGGKIFYRQSDVFKVLEENMSSIEPKSNQ